MLRVVSFLERVQVPPRARRVLLTPQPVILRLDLRHLLAPFPAPLSPGQAVIISWQDSPDLSSPAPSRFPQPRQVFAKIPSDLFSTAQLNEEKDTLLFTSILNFVVFPYNRGCQ